MKSINVLFLIFFIATSCFAEIRIVLTAALTDHHYEFRKNQYLESFEILKKLGYVDFYIIEAGKQKSITFLNDFCSHVFYASNPTFKNNGINESKTILEGLNFFNFDPEDMIIKFTGRYKFLSDHFINLVKNNSHYDAFVKIGTNGFDIYTLCFAMKCKYMKEMYEHIDYSKMEREWINIEHEVANYIHTKKNLPDFNVCFVDKLDVEANIFGSSSAPGANQILMY